MLLSVWYAILEFNIRDEASLRQKNLSYIGAHILIAMSQAINIWALIVGGKSNKMMEDLYEGHSVNTVNFSV